MVAGTLGPHGSQLHQGYFGRETVAGMEAATSWQVPVPGRLAALNMTLCDSWSRSCDRSHGNREGISPLGRHFESKRVSSLQLVAPVFHPDFCCGPETLVSTSACFKSPLMLNTWGVTRNIVRHLPTIWVLFKWAFSTRSRGFTKCTSNDI